MYMSFEHLMHNLVTLRFFEWSQKIRLPEDRNPYILHVRDCYVSLSFSCKFYFISLSNPMLKDIRFVLALIYEPIFTINTSLVFSN
jgi:hypothetical protein